MYYNLVQGNLLNTNFKYLCASSDGTYAFGDNSGQMLFLREADAKLFGNLNQPQVEDVYLTVINGKNVISDNIVDIVDDYLSNFNKDATIMSCKYDMVLKSLDSNFQMNTDMPLHIRRQIAETLVNKSLPNIDETLRLNCISIIASAGNTAAITGVLDEDSEEYEEDYDIEDDSAQDDDSIQDDYDTEEYDEDSMQDDYDTEEYDEEEYEEYEEEYEEDDDFFEQTPIDKLYNLLQPEQVELIQEFCLWNSQRIVNKATNQQKLHATRQISMRKAEVLDEIRGNDSWVYAGWYKVHRGFHTCSLGHHLTNVHLAWRLDEDADVSESFWGKGFDKHIDELVKSGRCVRFGSTCVGDFFDIDKQLMSQILKAQRDTERDLKTIYDIYALGKQDEAMASYKVLDEILPHLKVNDAKAVLLKRPYTVPYMEPGVIPFYERFKAANLLMPKALVQLIRDNIMRWESHNFTHKSSEKEINTILHFNTIPAVTKTISDIWGNKYSHLVAQMTHSSYYESTRYSGEDLKPFLPYLANYLFMYETCGIYKFDAAKNKDEGGTSKPTKDALARLNAIVAKATKQKSILEVFDDVEQNRKLFVQVFQTLRTLEKTFYENIRYNYLILAKNSYYDDDWNQTECIPVVIEDKKISTITDGVTEVQATVDKPEEMELIDKFYSGADDRLAINGVKLYYASTEFDGKRMKYITQDDNMEYTNRRSFIMTPYLNFIVLPDELNPLELEKKLITYVRTASALLDLYNDEQENDEDKINLISLRFVKPYSGEVEKILSQIQQIDPIAMAQKYDALCEAHLANVFKSKTEKILKEREKQDLAEVPVNTIEDLIIFLSNNIEALQDDKYQLHRGVLNTASSYEDKSSISTKMLFRLQEAYEAITGKEAPDFQVKVAVVQNDFTKLDDVPDIKKKLEYMVHQMPNKLQQRDLSICQTVLKYQRYSKNQSYAVMRAVNIYNDINP